MPGENLKNASKKLSLIMLNKKEPKMNSKNSK